MVCLWKLWELNVRNLLLSVISITTHDFYVSCFQGLAEAFLDHLWKKLHDPNNPSVIRQTAGSYIGSFLARAKFIPVV